MSLPRRFVLVGSMLLISGTAVAQEDVSPRAGTWGAETGTHPGVVIMRFQSPTWAWLAGVNAFYTDLGPGISQFTGELRLGIRQYRKAGERVRPFWSIGPIIGYDDTEDASNLRYGGALDVGAAYFFNRHVSLGTSLDINAVRFKTVRFDPLRNEVIEQDAMTGRVGLRLLGAVYF